jgi:acyl-coenzyme A thioesterase PaaI-like protein
MPASDFSTQDPDFSQEQEEQCARLIAGLRKVNSKIVRLGGSLDALTSAADRVEALLASLDEVTQSRAIPSYRYEFDPARPNDVIPFNPATGEFNPISPGIEMSVEGKKLVATCEYSNCYESAPDTAQGGMVAAVFDQVLAYAMMLEGATGPTLWLKVNFLKPTPINQPLRFEAEVTAIEGRKVSVRGSCYCGDLEVSSAEALILKSYDIPFIGGTAEDDAQSE